VPARAASSAGTSSAGGGMRPAARLRGGADAWRAAVFVLRLVAGAAGAAGRDGRRARLERRGSGSRRRCDDGGLSRADGRGSAHRGECHHLPIRDGGELQVTGQIGQAFDLRGHDGGLDPELLARGDGRAPLVGPAGLGGRGVQNLALADELRGEFRGAAVLARRAAQDQSVAAILDDLQCVS
jgi:hypothetical protein